MTIEPNLSAKEGLDRLAKRLKHCRAWHGPRPRVQRQRRSGPGGRGS